jgi:hypothetical protein
MNKKWTTKKRTTLAFTATLILVMLLNLITSDIAISMTERRKLKPFPELTTESLLSGDFFEDFEKYAVDQMVYRTPLRNLKALIEYGVFQKYDNNSYFITDGHVFKMDYDKKLQEYKNSAKQIEAIYERYLTGLDVYHAIIPDKNYFIRNDDKYLFNDYNAMIATINAGITHSTYIDLFGALTLDDYHRTDLHWKQDHLGGVMLQLESAMGFKTSFDATTYTTETLSPFYGAYHGGAAGLIGADSITYLTNDSIEGAVALHYSENGETTAKDVYDTSAFSGVDGYDLFLSGPTPIVEIQNPANTSGKSLVIFRDSFASSLAPLLLEEYSTVTLVDLRYVSMDLIGEYVDFGSATVLFITTA